MQIWHFNRLSNNSHSTTIQHQISYQYRYFIHLRESQCPNRALPQPLPSIVQTVSGLTLNRGLPELRTVLRSRWSLGGKIKGQNTQSWIKYDYWYYIWHCYVFKCEWFDNLLKNCLISIHDLTHLPPTTLVFNDLGKINVEKNLLMLG